jgi:hypothetical protein
MTHIQEAAGVQVRDERVAALRALGHSGSPETHKRGLLKRLDREGLVYEKTAQKLLNVSRMRLRRLILPEEWITNPAYTTAPSVPVYDPRTLLAIKREIEQDPVLAVRGIPSVIDARMAIDEGKRDGYRAFRSRARDWHELQSQRRWERRWARGEFNVSAEINGPVSPLVRAQETSEIISNTGIEQNLTDISLALEAPRYLTTTVEVFNKQNFVIERDVSSYEVKRLESEIVNEYQTYLRARGHAVVRHQYTVGPDHEALFCDLFDETDWILFEAKGDVTREKLRMAVGQLFDYRRFYLKERPPVLAVLLPRRPSNDLWQYLRSLKIRVIFKISKDEWEVAE